MYGEFEMRLLRLLKRVPIKIFGVINVFLGQIIYVNAAGLIQNLVGKWLMFRSKKNFEAKEIINENDDRACKLRSEGYLNFGHLVNDNKVKSLSKKFSSWCKKNKHRESQFRLQISSKDYGDQFLEDFPEISTLMDDVLQSTIVNYYGCDFEVINVHIYRTRKPDNVIIENAGTAYGGTLCWHSDGSYTDTLKVFFLLSEVGSEDGPMLLMDKKRSENIFKSNIPFNFLKHGRPDLPDFQNWSSAFTGTLGQCLVVDTNSCLHRASVPGKKTRDMVTFYIGVKKNNSLDRFHDIRRTGEGLTGRFS